MKLIIRITNAIKIGWWALLNPQALNHGTLKMLSQTMCMIMAVANEKKHRMTHIAYIHPETGKDHEIVSIWAGAGVASSPVKRISELLEENAKLKDLLGEMTNRNTQV